MARQTLCIVMCLMVSLAPVLTQRAAAQPLPSGVAVDASSDASMSLDLGQNLTWTHAPVGSPNLVTASCAVHQSGVMLAAAYGGTAMASAVTNQQSNQFVEMFYLSHPNSGAQLVVVTLTAAGGPADVQCSATTWTGVGRVDLSIANTAQDLSGVATHVAIGPSSRVPAGEIFFAAIHRYIPQGAPTLSVSPSNASLVDSNTNMGNGFGYGCEAVTFAAWEDCIGTGKLSAGGTSMTFSWTTYGYAVVAGFGLIQATTPVSGGSAESTILGMPTLSFIVLILLAGVGAGAIVVVLLVLRAQGRSPRQ